MLSYKFIFLALSICIGICSGQEAILVTASASGIASLNCTWTSPVNSCFWIRNGRELNATGHQHYLFYGKNECCMIIHGIESQDEGRWMCGFKHGALLTLSKEVIISKSEKVPTTSMPRKFLVQPHIQYVLNGNDAILNCSFTFSSPHCFWMKDGNITAIIGRYSYLGNINDGNCTIRIAKVQYSDNGQWQCGYPQTDSESLLKSEKASLSVTVMPEEPVLVVNGIPMKNGTKLYLPSTPSGNLQISCWSENGSPASTIQWGTQTNSTNYKPVSPNTDSTYQTKVTENSNAKQLKIAARIFYSAQMNWQWSNYYLVCSVSHPTYDRNHTTCVHLVFGYNQQTQQTRYYG